MKMTILQEGIMSVKPFESVIIGDPLYFEEMENGSTNENLKNLTCDIQNIETTNHVAGVTLRLLECDYNDEDLDFVDLCYELKFYTAKNTKLAQKIVYAELGDEYIPELREEFKEFGCDTAKFTLGVDDYLEDISTMSDGYYGYMSRYKNDDAYIFTLHLDAAIFDWDIMTNIVDCFFEVL